MFVWANKKYLDTAAQAVGKVQLSNANPTTGWYVECHLAGEFTRQRFDSDPEAKAFRKMLRDAQRRVEPNQ